MTGLEIALFILGTAFVIISFFIVENNDRTPKAAATSALDADSFEELREGFVTKSQKEADIILAETKEKLEDVSNDKIIAVGEYSDQILEKINSNHKEVVFLYQMLNEKEEELKTAVTKMDNTRIECEKMLKEAEEAKAKAAEQPAPAAPVRRPAAAAAPKAVIPASVSAKQTKPPVRTVTKPASSPAVSAGTSTGRPVQPNHVTPVRVLAEAKSEPNANADTGSFNRNDEIIALYKKGKSVMEISKLLGIGQGEVRLIINLYC